MIRAILLALGLAAVLPDALAAQSIDALRDRFDERRAAEALDRLRQTPLCDVTDMEFVTSGPWQNRTQFRLSGLSRILKTLDPPYNPSTIGDVQFDDPAPDGQITFRFASIPDLPVRRLVPTSVDALPGNFGSETGRPLRLLLKNPAFVDLAGCEASRLPTYELLLEKASGDVIPFGYLVFVTERLAYQINDTGPGGIQGEDGGYATSLLLR